MFLCAFAACLAPLNVRGAPAATEVANDFFSLIFYPEFGGVAVLTDKESRTRLSTVDLDSQVYPGGLFEAKLWYPRYLSFCSAIARQELSENPDATEVRFFAQGSGSIEGWLRLKRTFLIPKKLPVIVCSEELENEPSSMINIMAGLWMRNVVGDVFATNHYLFPTQKQIEQKMVTPGSSEFSQEYCYNPGAGWAAVITGNGLGLGMSFDQTKLDCIYQFSGSSPGNLEWGYRAVNLAPGEKFNVEYRVFLFRGLKTVDYVCDIGALEFEEGEKGKMRLAGYASVNGGIDVAINAFRQTIKLEAGKPWNSDWVEKANKARVNIRFQGKEAADFEKDFQAKTVLAEGHDKPKSGLGKNDLKSTAKNTGKLQPITVEKTTPHFKWGKPFAAGSIRVLALTDYVHEREVAELCQRFDFEAAPSVGMPFMTAAMPGDIAGSMEQCQNSLLKLIEKEKWDVIVLAGVDFDRQLNAEIRKSIAKSVGEGTGLVIISGMGGWPENPSFLPASGAKWNNDKLPLGSDGKIAVCKPHYLTSALDWSAWPVVTPIIYPQTKGEPLLRTDKTPILIADYSNKGRVAAWLYSAVMGKHDKGATGITSSGPKSPEVEYEFAAIGKSIIWAAGKEIKDAVINNTPCHTNGNTLVVNAAYRLDPDKKAEMECALVTANKAEIWEQTKTLPEGDGSNSVFQIPLPETAGDNFIHVRLLNQSGKIMDWGYKKIRCEKGYSLSIFSDCDSHKVTLKVFNNAKATVENLETTLTAYDPDNNILNSIEAVSDHTGTIEWSLPVHFWGRRWLIVKGSVCRNDGCQLDQVFCRIGQPRHDSIKPLLISWGYPGAILQMQYLRDFYFDRFGNDIDGFAEWHATGKKSEDAVKASERSVIPCPTYWGAEIHVEDFIANRKKYLETNDIKCLVRKPSLADKAFVDGALKATRKMAEYYKDFQPILYVAGDEMSMSYYHEYFDYDFHPAALAYFQAWARKKHGPLEKANSAWGTSFKSWEEIRPDALEQAKKRGTYTLWNDFRTCMEDLLTDYYQKIAQEIKSVAPDGCFAISGTQRPGAGNGIDWWKLSQPQVLQGALAYGGFGSNNMRWSFSKGTLKAFPYAIGYNITGIKLSMRIWEAALEQSFGVGMFDFQYLIASGAYKPSLSEAISYIKEWRQGYWDLIYNAKRRTDAAIYYSQNSLHLSRILGQEEDFMDELDGWRGVISDLGYAYKFISYAQVEKGCLIDDGVKILVLPQTFSLSDAEAKGIMDFVENGGTVLASGACGTYDENLKPRDKNALNAVLGFDLDLADGPAVMNLNENGGDPLSVKQCGAVKGDPGQGTQVLLRDSRKSLPLATVNKTKEGKSVWLGFRISQFNFDCSNEQMMNRWRKIVGQVSKTCPVKPLYIPGNGFIGQVYSYTSGDVELVGIISDKDKCRLEVNSCAIDIPHGKRLLLVKENGLAGNIENKNNKANINLKGGGACLIAFVPEKRDGPEMAVKADEKNGEISWQVACKGHLLPVPVISVNLIDPAGKERQHKVLLFENGKTTIEGKAFIAPQDPFGRWKLEVCDVLTGKKTSARFERTK